MKKLSIVFYFIILFAMVLPFACKKYPEGPFITFRSVENRLDGKWQVVEFTSDGIDSLQSFKDSCGSIMWIKIPHDGNYVIDFMDYKIPFGAVFDFSGYKDAMVVQFGPSYPYPYHVTGIGPIGGGNKESKWKILKLTEKKFKISTDFNGRNYIILSKK